jgi:site-specific DNA-adenine methylase
MSGKLHHRGKHKRTISSLIFDVFHPIEFSDYIEPFLGTSSNLFQILALVKSGDLYIRGNIYASDADFRTINFYKQVQTNVDEVIAFINEYTSKALTYYAIRDQFLIDPKWGTPSNAAMFYILHRNSFHCCGNDKNNITATAIDEPFLRNISKLIQGVNFENLDFQEAMAKAAPDSLIYIDTPTLSTFSAYVDIKTILFPKLSETVRVYGKISTIVISTKQLEMFAVEFTNEPHARFFIIPSIVNFLANELVVIISPHLS